MSGQSKSKHASTNIPRRSTRGKISQETASAPDSQLLAADSKLSNGQASDQPQNSKRSEKMSMDVDISQIGDNPRRSGRKIQNKASYRTQGLPNLIEDPLKYVMVSTTASELETWKGWCEVESEPAFFNVMLRNFGVEGIKVQEVFSLDDEMLNLLPKPIYGLIFLFQFKEDDSAMQEASCPDTIWFANQTISNACASIALLNIVMNIRGIDLGPTLEQLRSFSMPLTPALRGYVVGNHDYLRKIHNSFSRKMDMLNADLFLSDDASSKKSNAKDSRKKGPQADSEQAGFHFIAFVPIDGGLWKLDGLERQPMNLGDYHDGDWMGLARPLIEKRMRQYEGDQIQFSLLALCQSPLIAVKNDLSVNICTIAAVEKRLQIVQQDWRQFVVSEESDKVLTGPDPSYMITPQGLEAASISSAVLREIEDSSIKTERLLELRRQLSDSQTQLRTSFVEEATAIQEDDERAATRRHDYTPMVNTWVAALADKGALQTLVNAASEDSYYD